MYTTMPTGRCLDNPSEAARHACTQHGDPVDVFIILIDRLYIRRKQIDNTQLLLRSTILVARMNAM